MSTKMAVVSRGTSHVTTNQRTTYTTSVDIQNMLHKATVIHYTVNWCMYVRCTQNMHQDNSSFTWHQPWNNQTALSVCHVSGNLKKCTVQSYSHSFRVTRDKSTASPLISREQCCVRMITQSWQEHSESTHKQRTVLCKNDHSVMTRAQRVHS